MSPMGRPEGESSPKRVSAEGSPVSPMGRPEGESSPKRVSAEGRLTTGGLVVVTGASGFVGAALVARLRAAGRPLLGTVREVQAGMPGELRPVGDLARASDDLLDDLVRGACAVVHLAGRAHVMRDTVADPEAAYRLANVETTARLARASVRAGVRRFVLASAVKAAGEASPPGRP